MNNLKVAIVGGGPAGIAAAKSLLEEGLTPVLIEQSSHIGGQWNQGAAHSGIWPDMHANSPHVLMSFSDFDHPAGTQMFPTNQEVLAYLTAYAHHFGLGPYIRLNTRVEFISRGPEGQYWVTTRTPDGDGVKELFSHVILASGRYNHPNFPATPGLDQFRGKVLHSFAYRGRQAFAGQRVLVVGNSISGLEIASDLALNDGPPVLSSCRKPRYIIRKLLHGMPAEQHVFNRFATYLSQVLPPPEAAAGLRKLIVESFGNPADFGGLPPSDNLLEAGVSMCQNYLDQLASGRIRAVTGVRTFTPTGAILTSGEEVTVDTILLATGFGLHLPFLSEDIRQTVLADDKCLDLHHFTFHPDLPNVAFLGLFGQIGSYFPTVELQARWVAACWSGQHALPTQTQMEQGLAEAEQFKQVRDEITSHESMHMFSHDLGVAPSLDRYPDLARELLFGLLVPAQFRLEGHRSRPDARARFEQNSRCYTAGQAIPLDQQQRAGLMMLARALPQNQALQNLVEQLQPEAVL
ncbi:flavin-containing monooxygenase [Hymenobacter sp. HDW8]|uniref:flavin-containing monooxygenase n=1 Tax=Hymenobacter sp. HDW8 TaxID=2714932 RepID=UPI00140B1B93|nr:NAD(P)-binding domain-containing protein [Hymenobacter sp. HDW8]QIL77641.1 NAD(P)-binding domain-containing protein [Hymenobacter sp. HDW8]